MNAPLWKETQSYICYNKEWIPLSQVEFVNVEENFFSGRDLVTFIKDGKEHTSFVVNK
jgi:hypothetical protein